MGERFFTPGSPLAGRLVPRDWAAMDYAAKRQALVDYGYAVDWGHAGGLMAGHSAAVRRYRKSLRGREAREFSS